MSTPPRVTTGPARSAAVRRRLLLGALAVVLAAALAVLTWVAVGTAAGQEADVRLSSRVQSLNDALGGLAEPVRKGIPVLLAVVCTVLGLLALRHRRWRAVLRAAAIVLASAGLARVLKDEVLTRPVLGPFGVAENTFPSGHVAVATALVVAALLLRGPARGRPVPRRPTRAPALPAAAAAAWAVLGAVVVLLACLASVLGHAHRLSDAIGAVLLVGAVAATVCALVPDAPPHGEDVPR